MAKGALNTRCRIRFRSYIRVAMFNMWADPNKMTMLIVITPDVDYNTPRDIQQL